MRILRRALVVALLLVVCAFTWIWLNRPQRMDMSIYAPASALVYLESDSVMNVADGIASTDTWKQIRPLLGETKSDWPNARMRRLIAFTGFGPTASVIVTRAQVAMVMLDLGTREEGETMTLKPEAALLIETHTPKWRIKSTVEGALQSFAEKFYSRPTFKRVFIDKDEFLLWTAADGDHQIVATIDSSLVIVANSDRAIKACLDARRGLRPSLHSETELQQMKNSLDVSNALGFGFVPSAHVGELLSLATPVALGRAPGGAQIDTLVARSGAKVLTSAGWTAKVVNGGIEDHYSFTLKPNVVSRMRPMFQAGEQSPAITTFVPESARSFSVYNFRQPDQTWHELQTTLSSQLDTLSAVLITSVLRSGLTPYGIDDPEKFLRLVGPEIATIRFEGSEASSVLVAKVRDELGLKQLLANPHLQEGDEQDVKVTANYRDGYLILGPAEEAQQCIQVHDGGGRTFKHLGSKPESVIVTFADDSDRVANFIAALARAQNVKAKMNDATSLKQEIQVPYAVTETSLSETGLDRRTLSPFGQFSALLPLLFPPK